MSTRQPRFEVVRSDAGWFARFRAANGQIQWTTEVYTRRRAADAAIDSINWLGFVYAPSYRQLEVRTIDEREATR